MLLHAGSEKRMNFHIKIAIVPLYYCTIVHMMYVFLTSRARFRFWRKNAEGWNEAKNGGECESGGACEIGRECEYERVAEKGAHWPELRWVIDSSILLNILICAYNFLARVFRYFLIFRELICDVISRMYFSRLFWYFV